MEIRCKCFAVPDKGKFVAGKKYIYEYVIDVISVWDENGNKFDFDEIKFLWYFEKL